MDMDPELILQTFNDENLLQNLLLADTLNDNNGSSPESSFFSTHFDFDLSDNFQELGLVLPPPTQIDQALVTAVKSEESLSFCPICLKDAGKHTHYGGRGCSSCRAFFRRSVQSKMYNQFACKADKSCEIDSKSWKSCKYCRFQKCLQSGMKPNLVLNEEERKIRHAKRTNGSAYNTNNAVILSKGESFEMFCLV